MEKEKINLSKEEEENYSSNNTTNNASDDMGASTVTFSKLLGKFAKFICSIIEKGNRNYFQFVKDNIKPCKLPITALAILLIIGFWPVAILLIVGLFFGYKYSFVGPNVKGNNVNNFMNKAYDGAQNIKNDFKEGYNENNNQ